MAFTSQRGRPRKPTLQHDTGTPELRLKHALRITAEPIDLCLEKLLISPEQHWCGLHLRWLYTLRYGAPSLTTYYTDHEKPSPGTTTSAPEWRSLREQEYNTAIQTLKNARRYEPVMRLSIYNESPAFLNARLQKEALLRPALQSRLTIARAELCEGLNLLAALWRHPRPPR